MQRVHEQDLTGWLVENQAGMWEVLKLPAVYEPENASPPTSIGWVDPRTRAGELLWESRMGPRQIEEQQRSMGAIMFAGQYQQRPVPSDGAIFKRDHFRFYDAITMAQIKSMFVVHSWDMAFKDTDGSDYVVGQVWGKYKSDFYLIDQVRGRLDFPRTVAAVVGLLQRWPAKAIYIEDKANGPAVIAALRQRVSGIIPVTPRESKQARAHAAALLLEAGNVVLPSPDKCDWVDALLDELLRFPRGRHDDQVDALTQALNQLSAKLHTGALSVAAMHGSEQTSAPRWETTSWGAPLGTNWDTNGRWSDDE